MRFKAIPEPASSPDRVAAVRAAVPETPDDETSCCARLVAEADVDDEDEAADWLVLLRALGLADADGEGRYSRTAREATPADLRAAFRRRVYCAEEVLAVLEAADGPLALEDVVDRVGERMPLRGRNRDRSVDVREARRREHVRRILGWAATLGLVRETPEGYLAGTDGPA